MSSDCSESDSSLSAERCVPWPRRLPRESCLGNIRDKLSGVQTPELWCKHSGHILQGYRESAFARSLYRLRLQNITADRGRHFILILYHSIPVRLYSNTPKKARAESRPIRTVDFLPLARSCLLRSSRSFIAGICIHHSHRINQNMSEYIQTAMVKNRPRDMMDTPAFHTKLEFPLARSESAQLLLLPSGMHTKKLERYRED